MPLRVCRFGCCLGILLFASGLGSGAAAPHVIQISVDGLGAKYLQFYLTNAPAEFPNFLRLQQEGACTYNARCDYHNSESIPNHATMLTGRPVLQPTGQSNTVHHGYTNNAPAPTHTFHNAGNPEVPYKASVFDVVHDRGLSTAFYASKQRLAICDRSYDLTNGAPDLIDFDNGRDKIDFGLISETAGTDDVSILVDALLAYLTATPHHYSFLHFKEPDVTGHSTGWGSAQWSNAVRQVDAQLGRILQAIEVSPVLSNRTVLLVTSDHGGGGVSRFGHTEAYHITNYTIPFFLWGPGIARGADLYSLFQNRADPGTNRLDYDAVPQPLRDGDASNMALALMGLPPIAGSALVPIFAPPPVALTITRSGAEVVVSWRGKEGEYALESAQTLVSGQWQPVSQSTTIQDGWNRHVVASEAEKLSQYFRLRKRE